MYFSLSTMGYYLSYISYYRSRFSFTYHLFVDAVLTYRLFTYSVYIIYYLRFAMYHALGICSLCTVYLCIYLLFICTYYLFIIYMFSMMFDDLVLHGHFSSLQIYSLSILKTIMIYTSIVCHL